MGSRGDGDGAIVVGGVGDDEVRDKPGADAGWESKGWIDDLDGGDGGGKSGDGGINRDKNRSGWFGAPSVDWRDPQRRRRPSQRRNSGCGWGIW